MVSASVAAGLTWAVLTLDKLGLVVAFGYPQFSEAAMYLLMLLVLLVRPRGLFGERIQRFE